MAKTIVRPRSAEASESPRPGTVITLGSGKLLVNGERGELAVQPGDQVIYGNYDVPTKLSAVEGVAGWMQFTVTGSGVMEMEPHPAPALGGGVISSPDTTTAWTSTKNQRRCDLIDKQIDGTLTPAEAHELESLQQQMLQFRRQVAPLPLAEAREMHRQLQIKAGMLDE